MYRECPLRFEKWYRKHERPALESKHYAVFGSVIQKIFEKFYNDQMYLRGASVQQDLLDMAPIALDHYLRDNYVDWCTPFFEGTPDDTLADIKATIPSVLQAIKDFKLLGQRNRSELKVQAPLGEDTLEGYLDFVIERDGEIIIVDGKGGQKKGKYVSSDQLKFYVLLYFMKYHQVPTKVAFLWYRFAEVLDTGALNTAPMWDDVLWTPADLKRLQSEIVGVLNGIKLGCFEPKPKPKTCEYCVYAKDIQTCRPYIAMKLARKARSDARKSAVALYDKGANGDVILR